MSRIIPVLNSYNARCNCVLYRDALRDLLTDVMHYCDANNIDFERKLRAARDVKEEEDILANTP